MTLNSQFSFALALVGVVMMTSLWQPVASHGRLWTPPARGTMWRKGFNTPKNYNDNELFCGGFGHQQKLGGMCGICGDPYDVDKPRPHEAGGLYATGTIAANYTRGQRVTLQVKLTASHLGWFEFKICVTNNPNVAATQGCLDQNVLHLQDGSGTKFYITKYGANDYDVPVILPPHLQCDFCVLQWRYHTGNSWGRDENGKGCMGCGPQEEFYGCADIRIKSGAHGFPGEGSTTPVTPTASGNGSPSSSSSSSGVPETSSSVPTTPFQPTRPTPTPNTESSLPQIFQCQGVFDSPGLDQWCDVVCNSDFCPVTHCRCQLVPEPRAISGNLQPGCYATTPFLNIQGLDGWCAAICGLGFCPKNKCFCVRP